MYKTCKIQEHDLKFYTKDIPAKQEKEKDNHDTTSKDYETIRKIVKGKKICQSVRQNKISNL
ncbi:MAG: hypothetical protein ACKPKO_28170 [Candidatus Fonsibacter sp.]